MIDWWHVSLLLSITVIIEAVALYYIQKASTTGALRLVFIAMAIYGLVLPILLYKMVTYEGIGMINFLWNIFSTLFGFLIGILLFKEKVNNLQWIGVALGVLAFALIILGDRQSAIPI